MLLGDRHREAALRNNRADLLHALGRPREAVEELARSVTAFSGVGDRDGLEPEIWEGSRVRRSSEEVLLHEARPRRERRRGSGRLPEDGRAVDAGEVRAASLGRCHSRRSPSRTSCSRT